MQRDDTRTLKRKVDSIITNINIYRRDIDKAMHKLKTGYDINELADIDEMLDEIHSELKVLDKKKEKLLRRASKLLNGITDED